MAGDGQQSSEHSTRNGIQALESAFSGIMKIRQDVDGTRSTLGAGYQGSDGGQYGQLLGQWDEQCNVILKNLEDVIDRLNQSLVEHNKTQGSSNDQINQAYNSSQSVFDQLAG
ncbi:uncharacterized protein YukE [Streptomyces sp. B3I7]|jgi:uncharacterized protein YukE|uniref:hypothetical protein n=1 Tax=unclassified Streptomyces TaxID=2593676 RepID=UPI002786FE1B|nr:MULTISPECIES: hypothetical protein [unclassified Streptomyces]MDQ0790860.1 uncharacterized protein YukE [Streptomyces sp. B3I8]MDQ0809437.1 uncharacterized protein YukE [Streptomyces sp. B3I7]